MVEISKRPSSKYRNKGIAVSPAVPAKGETAKVVYNGLLVKNGADKMYVHVGFGCDWQKAMEYKMVKTSAGFETGIPVTIADNMNMCFKDSAGNWDNNSGKNYTIDTI
ncbi:MAG: hypothetical protein H6Q74_1459 [Firmicutes bacterium]|nr:hypothetical protein [Bacillota bacterium]